MLDNNPIQTLMDEHETIQSAESRIHSMEHTWNDNASLYEENAYQLLTFFKEYSDKYHHYKEETVLFPTLNAHPEFMLPEIIDELLDHHCIFRDMINEIGEALDYKKWEHSYVLFKKYFNDLLDHIAVENDELFIMAEQLLDDNELERMYFRFKDIDNELGETRKIELKELFK